MLSREACSFAVERGKAGCGGSRCAAFGWRRYGWISLTTERCGDEAYNRESTIYVMIDAASISSRVLAAGVS